MLNQGPPVGERNFNLTPALRRSLLASNVSNKGTIDTSLAAPFNPANAKRRPTRVWRAGGDHRRARPAASINRADAGTPPPGNHFIFPGVSALLVVVLDDREVVEQTVSEDGRGQILDRFTGGMCL